MSNPDPLPERERLEWQLRWQERRADEAWYWLNWRHLPEESEQHWRARLKHHHREAGKLRLALVSCT